MGFPVFLLLNEEFSLPHSYLRVKKLTDVNHPFLY